MANCRVLPTSAEDGLIECVPSMALARVIAEHKSIHRYWALYNADPSGASQHQLHLSKETSMLATSASSTLAVLAAYLLERAPYGSMQYKLAPSACWPSVMFPKFGTNFPSARLLVCPSHRFQWVCVVQIVLLACMSVPQVPMGLCCADCTYHVTCAGYRSLIQLT